MLEGLAVGTVILLAFVIAFAYESIHEEKKERKSAPKVQISEKRGRGRPRKLSVKSK